MTQPDPHDPDACYAWLLEKFRQILPSLDCHPSLVVDVLRRLLRQLEGFEGLEPPFPSEPEAEAIRQFFKERLRLSVQKNLFFPGGRPATEKEAQTLQQMMDLLQAMAVARGKKAMFKELDNLYGFRKLTTPRGHVWWVKS